MPRTGAAPAVSMSPIRKGRTGTERVGCPGRRRAARVRPVATWDETEQQPGRRSGPAAPEPGGSGSRAREPERRQPWVRPMLSRAVDESPRASTPLELLFDLTFGCLAVVPLVAAGLPLGWGVVLLVLPPAWLISLHHARSPTHEPAAAT